MRPPSLSSSRGSTSEPAGFVKPDKSLSLTPFWFWNDALEPNALLARMAEFEDRGIHAFVVHPRIGLPREFGWMSSRLLHCMRVVIEEASRRGMKVILYDEAMYPSGSSGGQVVAENPDYACRGLVMQDEAPVDSCQHVVLETTTRSGCHVWILDRPIHSAIRGVHFCDGHGDEREEGETWLERRAAEDRPPATDLLNPDAVVCFIRLVYERYFEEFGSFFGTTIPAIFTDEPYVLGRFSPFDARPGTTGILQEVSQILGYDFTPHLPALWLDEEPDAERYRIDYRRAISRRLEETYYRPISQWCRDHGIALTGHPELADDIGQLRHFQWPGQDVILQDILPGEKSVTGPPSTQAKCAASSAIHLGRSRNLNEFMGAYGENVSLDTYRFVANWLLVRGCNMLVPHAFFLSIRGARIDDCPPQLGPHGPWWHDPALVEFHLACQRLCWVNFESVPRCRVAVLGRNDHLPERVARVLYENQIDFHYLEDRHLQEDAVATEEGIEIGPMRYNVLVAEEAFLHERVVGSVAALAAHGRVLVFERTSDLVADLRGLVSPTVELEEPAPSLRARLVEKEGGHWLMLANEGVKPIAPLVTFPQGEPWCEISPVTSNFLGQSFSDSGREVVLKTGELRLYFQQAD